MATSHKAVVKYHSEAGKKIYCRVVLSTMQLAIIQTQKNTKSPKALLMWPALLYSHALEIQKFADQ